MLYSLIICGRGGKEEQDDGNEKISLTNYNKHEKANKQRDILKKKKNMKRDMSRLLKY